jgi:hypothetical protein
MARIFGAPLTVLAGNVARIRQARLFMPISRLQEYGHVRSRACHAHLANSDLSMSMAKASQ